MNIKENMSRDISDIPRGLFLRIAAHKHKTKPPDIEAAISYYCYIITIILLIQENLFTLTLINSVYD